MKFCWTTILVRDMEESIRFYQEIAGLPVNKRFAAGPDSEIAFLGDGETKIELISSASRSQISYGDGITCGFEVDSIDEFIDLLTQKGVRLHSGPFSPNPSVKFIYVLDPNGMKLQFVENL